jgi:hypothetical protein
LTTQNTTPGIDNNSDANPANGFTPAFDMDPNGTGLAKTNLTIDAGFLILQIGDYLWFDGNADGSQGETERPVSGVTVALYDQSGNAVQVCQSDNASTDFASTSDNDGSFGFGSNWILTGSNTTYCFWRTRYFGSLRHCHTRGVATYLLPSRYRGRAFRPQTK